MPIKVKQSNLYYTFVGRDIWALIYTQIITIKEINKRLR